MSGSRTADIAVVNRINVAVWFMFFFCYSVVSAMYTTLRLAGVPYPFRASFHLAFYTPLGLYLWRREYSLYIVVFVLLLLSITPECIQYYYKREILHDFGIDVSLNIIGGIIGIAVGMVWTLRSLITK